MSLEPPSNQTDRERRRSLRTPGSGTPNRRSRVKSKTRSGSRAASACISKDCRRAGEIYIGEKTIIGPGCSITSYGGPIHIGNQNVLTECVQISNRSDEPMVIGDCNIFETGARVEARKIGSCNMFAAKSHVQAECIIGNGCVIGPKMQMIKKTTVPDYNIMAANNLVLTQKTFKRRNTIYVQKMVKLLSHQFHQANYKDRLKRHPRAADGKTGKASTPSRREPNSNGAHYYRKDNSRLDPKAAAERMISRRDKPSTGATSPKPDPK